LTWYGQNGFYLDGQAQATWYESDLSSGLLGSLSNGNDGFGYAFSLEFGKRLALNQSWTLTPQAQLAYSSVDFDDFTDPFGANVSLGTGESLKGRLGLSADYENAWESASGTMTRTHLYGIANLYPRLWRTSNSTAQNATPHLSYAQQICAQVILMV
jgi:fibronectin-binding autotransporter adhesin